MIHGEKGRYINVYITSITQTALSTLSSSSTTGVRVRHS